MLIHGGALRISSVHDRRCLIFSYVKCAKTYLETAEMKKLMLKSKECAKKLERDFAKSVFKAFHSVLRSVGYVEP